MCPSCHAEYRSGFERCASCDVDLVEPGVLEDEARAYGTPKEMLAGKELARIPQPNLDACRDLERQLIAAEIPCYVNAEEADADVAFGSAASIMYTLVIARDDIPQVKDALKGRFEKMLENQGLGSFNTEAVDLESETVTCPACGHEGALDDEGSCADCGLFLGAPD